MLAAANTLNDDGSISIYGLLYLFVWCCTIVTFQQLYYDEI